MDLFFYSISTSFYNARNYKIKTSDFDISLLNGGWWLSDEIVTKGDHYLLDLKFDTAKCKTKHLEISFRRAEVIRE